MPVGGEALAEGLVDVGPRFRREFCRRVLEQAHRLKSWSPVRRCKYGAPGTQAGGGWRDAFACLHAVTTARQRRLRPACRTTLRGCTYPNFLPDGFATRPSLCTPRASVDLQARFLPQEIHAGVLLDGGSAGRAKTDPARGHRGRQAVRRLRQSQHRPSELLHERGWRQRFQCPLRCGLRRRPLRLEVLPRRH